MTYYDHNQQHIAAAVSAAVSSVTTASSLFGRSLSAPHIQLAGMPQGFVPCRSSLSMDHDMTMTNHMTSFSPQPLPQFTHPFDQVACQPSLPYSACPPPQPVYNPSLHHGDHGVTYQQPIHPFQTEQFSSSVNNLESATAAKIKFEYQEDMPTHPMSCATGINQHLEDVKAMDMPFRTRGPTSMYNSNLSRFEVPEEYPAYMFPRHGSLGSLYPMTQSHELLDSQSTSMESVPMIPTASSTSITSVGSISSVSSTSSSGSNSSISSPCSNSASSATSKARARRASFNPDISTRVFTCNLDDCGKLFKRSEHLKRHVRDNLNQHIRIHRHDKEKGAKSFNFTPLNPVGAVQA